MNKSHSLVKKLKKEVIIEAVEETTQVESSVQKLEEPVYGGKNNIDEDNQLEISEDVEEVHAAVLEQKEENKSVELDQNVNDIQEDMVNVFVATKIEVDNIQNISTKTKGKSRVEVKSDGVLISSLNFHGKSYAMIGESNWRPKTRRKNKLRLNMKNLLNPKLAKEKITVIDSDSSSQENLKEYEDLSEQVDNKREDLVIEKPSPVKDTVK